MNPKNPIRSFLPQDLVIEKWEDVSPFYDDLLERNLDSKENLDKWLEDVSELGAFVSENYAWRYIRVSCDTKDKDIKDSLEYFQKEILPHMEPMVDKLNKKLINCKYVDELDKDVFGVYIRSVKNSIELFREENIELGVKNSLLQNEYNSLVGGIMIDFEGKKYTPQQMKVFLEDVNKEKRKCVYEAMKKKREVLGDELNSIYSKMLSVRHETALNAGFENYRDYIFRAAERFDYTPSDCFAYHDGIEKYMKPLYESLLEEKKRVLGVDVLHPWDLMIDEYGDEPLRPFAPNQKEILEKVKNIFRKERPKYADFIQNMEDAGHFDIESREGKEPGAYNYPLGESGMPFIFGNSVGIQRDLETMVHECGHALHSMCMKENNLMSLVSNYKYEIAEVASMSQELMTMDYWDECYDEKDLWRAKMKQLNGVCAILCWVAVVDAFQHWTYCHPDHSLTERFTAWRECFTRFQPSNIEWTNYEYSLRWHEQSHIFDNRFYYIEYGIAQIGALGVWKNYREDKEKALDAYEKALGLGNTKALPELFEAANIKFDMSAKNIKELAEFLEKEIEKLKQEKN